MQSSTKHGLIVLAVFAALGGGYYVLMNTKRHYASVIVNKGKYGSGVDALMTFDKPYLKAWAKAAKSGATNFNYNGRTINTQGGRAI